MNDADPHLVIVEDDARFAETLAAEFRDRGYRVSTVENLAQLATLDGPSIDYAVIDLRLRQDSGLDAIAMVKERDPEARIVVLTGYGSIATAVQATKLGAANYLTKPVDIDDIERAFEDDDDQPIAVPEEFQSLARHEREYIEFVLAECDGNISRAARRLGLHRQSLQRKLRKYTPR
ncbi:MAG: response regulator [Proteobacteria bacterium]|nr:response regulator [Pseudomonadota bacterium]MCZ6784749.1 response regulator [Pseudomonadota bacterium]